MRDLRLVRLKIGSACCACRHKLLFSAFVNAPALSCFLPAVSTLFRIGRFFSQIRSKEESEQILSSPCGYSGKVPSIWLVMSQRVAAFRTYFSRRRAGTVTVGASLSLHWLRVCGEIHIVLSSRLHCLLQPVVVSPLWGGSFTYLTLIFQRFSSSLCAYFFHLYRLWNLPRETEINAIVSLILCRMW